jgi:hypothetical protein
MKPFSHVYSRSCCFLHCEARICADFARVRMIPSLIPHRPHPSASDSLRQLFRNFHPPNFPKFCDLALCSLTVVGIQRSFESGGRASSSVSGVSGGMHSCLSNLYQRSILPFDCGYNGDKIAR